MEVIISGTNREHLELIKKMAKELGLNIQDRKRGEYKDEKPERRKKAFEAMEELIELDPFKDIKDPVAWQREVRKDRNIGRDE